MLKKSLPYSDAVILQAKSESNNWQLDLRASQPNMQLIQRIISSNEELIHEQMMKIR